MKPIADRRFCLRMLRRYIVACENLLRVRTDDGRRKAVGRIRALDKQMRARQPPDGDARYTAWLESLKPAASAACDKRTRTNEERLKGEIHEAERLMPR